MTGIATRDVAVELGGRQLLDGVDFALAEGVVTLLAGRNGCGKTTLLTVLAGLRDPDRGVVTLGQQNMRELVARERARVVTVIPQDADSPFEFTGRELVMMGRHPHISRFGSAGPRDFEAVAGALRRADAEAFADRPVHTLSGGERRRITIARALATEARILLADEPTANLDLDHALAALDLFRELAAEGRTVLIVSHDLNLVAPYSDRVALLHDGRIAFEGDPEDALSTERMRDVFGVESGPAAGFFPRRFGRP